MQNCFNKLSGSRLMVVGDVMLDCYAFGETRRISPEAPVPVVKVQRTEDRLGGAANVASNIATLGAQAALIGISGIDTQAEVLASLIQAQGIEAHLIEFPHVATICKKRIVSQNQQLLRLDTEDDLSELDKALLNKKIQQGLDNTDIVVLSDYNKGTLSHVTKIIEMAKAVNIPVIVDPKGDDFSNYYGADLLTPNQKEFELIVGACKDEQTLVERGLQLIDDYELGGLLITRGAQGMTLLRPARPSEHFATTAREVYDVTGAGDTVISVLASILATGEPIETAVRYANIAAGLVIGRFGTAAVSSTELQTAISEIMTEAL